MAIHRNVGPATLQVHQAHEWQHAAFRWRVRAWSAGECFDKCQSVDAGRGVKFQQSKFVGSGRTSTKATLISSLEACDRVVVVDVTGFPLVRFIPIDATRLISAAHTERLTSSGWSKSRLYDWLREKYDVSEITLAL